MDREIWGKLKKQVGDGQADGGYLVDRWRWTGRDGQADVGLVGKQIGIGQADVGLVGGQVGDDQADMGIAGGQKGVGQRDMW